MSSAHHEKKGKLLDQVRNLIRRKHYSYSTEKVYVYWIRNFIIFNNKRHPIELGAEDIKKYLTWLAKVKRVSASTQNQALNAIVFLYKRVLEIEPGNFDGALRAKASNYIPQIISREKILDMIECSNGVYKLMIILLYGCGLRVGELFSLRVKDIDFDHRMITVYMGKGNKSRTIMLPEFAVPHIKSLLKKNRVIYESDCEKSMNGVEMPNALDRKYPSSSREWGWFWLFPAPRYSKDPRCGINRRHHLHKSTLQKHVKIIRNKLNIIAPIRPHSFRHCFATHLLEEGKDISTVQRLLGHSSIKTTMVYLHVLESRGTGVASPLDSVAFKTIVDRKEIDEEDRGKRKPQKVVKIKRASENRKGSEKKESQPTPKKRINNPKNFIPGAIASNDHLKYGHVCGEQVVLHQTLSSQQVDSRFGLNHSQEQFYQLQSSVFP